MTGADVYHWLINGSSRSICEQFDRHVVACVLSLSFEEARAGRPLCQATGLTPPELQCLAEEFFPHAVPLFSGLDPTQAPTLSEDETCLRHLLQRSTTERSRFQHLLAGIVARRAQGPNHLWQDLGLRSRRELSWLMQRHFEPLANRNAQDMKWKKFLYRVICRDEGFSICTAPSCRECCDFEQCFGEENGESLLALARRDAELGVSQNRQTADLALTPAE